MKQLPFFILLLPLAVSCKNNDYGSYHLSLTGWVILGTIAIAAFLIFVLKKGVVEEVEENKTVNTTGVSPNDFESMGNYIGGHPGSENMITGTVFKKNSDCCLFFYKDKSYNMPEFKFKIKVKAFKNISVEDFASIEKKIASGHITLTGAAISALKKRENGPTAFVTIDWTDGISNHSAVFSFDGKEAVQKAKIARDNFLRAVTRDDVNPVTYSLIDKGVE